MRGAQSSFKGYGAISPWVGDDFNEVGTYLFPTQGKHALLDRGMCGLGSGGGGDAAVVYESNAFLIIAQDGGVIVSNVSTNEVENITRLSSNISTTIWGSNRSTSF